MWSASEFLAGYEQQDAHEFLIAVLDSLHGHLDRAARDESSAPVLRRTLAAHKQRAKQKKQEAAAEQELKAQAQAHAQQQQQQSLPSPPAKKQQQQKQHQQPPQKKKAGKQNGGRSGGGSASLSAAAVPPSPKLTAKTVKAAAAEAAAAAAAAAAARGGGKDSDATKNRKRSRSASGGTDTTGWESQSASSPAGRSNGERLGGNHMVGSPSSPASAHSSSSAGRRGGSKTQPPGVDHDPATVPWQSTGVGGGGSEAAAFAQQERANGASVSVSSLSTRKMPLHATENGGSGDMNGSETGRRAGWNPRGGEGEEYGTAEASAGRGQGQASKKGSMLNGQCLEDLNLAGFVQEVFAGVTRSDVVCTACGDVSCTYERFLEVSLPVRAGEQERRQQQEQLEREREQQLKLEQQQQQQEEERKQEAARLLKCADGEGGGGGSRVAECFVGGSSSIPVPTTNTEHGGTVAAKAAGVLRVVDDVVTATEIPNGDGGGVRVGGTSSSSSAALSSSSSSSLSSLSPSVSPVPPVTPVRSSTPAAQPAAPQVPQQQPADPSSGRASPAGCGAVGGKDNDPSSSEVSASVSQATTPSTGRASPASTTFSDDSAGRPLGAAAAEEGEANAGRSSPPPRLQGKAKSSPSRSSPSPKNGRAGGIGGRRGGGRSRAAAPGPARSITDCFARFAARENLTVRMACDSCSATSVCKTKQMSFCSLPRVLVLHLKRFDAMADRKIDVSWLTRFVCLRCS